MEKQPRNRAIISRRTAFGMPAAMLLASGPAGNEQPTSSGARTLVAYFSRSGNTRVIAGQLKRDLGADLFEIVPAEPYPDDYEQTVEQARRERDAGIWPALKTTLPNIDQVDTIFLGFPIWGETAPPIIRSFLAAHDVSGKIVRPFITHGGFGLGNSLSMLRDHASRARILEPFSMEADQERRTMNQVRDWLATIQARDVQQ